jgi:hypothetical protein
VTQRGTHPALAGRTRVQRLKDLASAQSYCRSVTGTPGQDRVWIQYKNRWYPGVVETWNTHNRDGVLRCWVTYAVPVNGWPGGWYESVLGDVGDDPNDEGRDWMDRVSAAAVDT